MLNNTWSEVGDNGGILSISHNVGKIGDTDSVLNNVTQEDFDSVVRLANNSGLPKGTWIGTHAWTGTVSTAQFARVINVSTVTTKSKLYRWLRTYYHHYVPSTAQQEFSGLEEFDKFREGAKRYLIPFDLVRAENTINLEFSDVVENTERFKSLVKQPTDRHLARWQAVNSFLYDQDLWNSAPVARFFEAEYEQLLETEYVYC